jgi:hypothetical protein
MRISSGNSNEEVNPEIIPWSTRDAAFLPFYLGGIAFTLFIAIPHLSTPYPILALLPGIATIYLSYKSLRAFEAHRNLKRLQILYKQLRSNR